MKEIGEQVLDVIAWCSKEIGKFEEDNFSSDLFNICQESGVGFTIKSPIEQVLYCALQTVSKLNFLYGDTGLCVFIYPQKVISKYRVDFFVSYVHFEKQKTIKEVIVECDSQTFHERSEKERWYEKQRDRFLQKEGYKVFHFTGAEILKNYMKIAAEIIAFVTGFKEADLLTDSNIPEEKSALV